MWHILAPTEILGLESAVQYVLGLASFLAVGDLPSFLDPWRPCLEAKFTTEEQPSCCGRAGN